MKHTLSNVVFDFDSPEELKAFERIMQRREISAYDIYNEDDFWCAEVFTSRTPEEWSEIMEEIEKK